MIHAIGLQQPRILFGDTITEEDTGDGSELRSRVEVGIICTHIIMRLGGH